MIPARWRAAQNFNVLRYRLTALGRDGLSSGGVRTYFSPHGFSSRTPRVRHPVSRVPQSQLPSFHQRPRDSLVRWRHSSSSKTQAAHVPRTEILESRFPTKTIIALLVVGGLIYYSIDVEFPSDFQLELFESFSNDKLARPWHQYNDSEEVDHVITHHMLNHADPGMRDPEFVKHILVDEFERLVFGWGMNEEEARDVGMPVTHGCRFRSNEPCEDYFALGPAPGLSNTPWNYWAIYDGHAGRHTAQYLQWSLIPHVSRALSSLHPSTSSPAITDAIQRAFVRVDDEMLNKARHAANWFPAASHAAITALTPVFSGSCALMSMYDPQSQKLRVACTGDSRAVLGRWDPSTSSYVCHGLSTDQTGFNEDEVERITAEHPEEEGIIDPNSGRLMGIAVTRAFGDHRWKWENSFIQKLQYKFWGPAPRPQSKTPPYMTAEPVVTETDIISVEPTADTRQRSDFMIMASDGLWDRISSEHAVECVQRWLEARERGNGSVRNDPRYAPPSFSMSSIEPDSGISYSVEDKQEIDWKATPEFFAIEDENAAVCLAKNAMGGTRRGLLLGLLAVPSPLCRNAIDDTTIMVVFFDQHSQEQNKKQGAQRPQVEGEKKRRWWMPW